MKLQLARAQALLNQKKPNSEEVVKILQPLISRKNTPWKAYYMSGIAYFMMKEFVKAESLFSRALEGSSQNPEIYYFIGRCRQNMNDYEGAIEQLKTAVEVKRDYYAAWMKLGDMQREAGNLNEAMQSYGQCNRIDPSKSEVAMKTGEIYRDQAFSEKALEMFDIVLKMEPENISALNEKAKLLKGKLELESAEEVIRQALDISPENDALRFTHAEILRESGDFLKALGIYEEILARKPKLGAARTNYANILQDLGRLNEAEEHFLQASMDTPSIQESFSNYLFVQHYNPEKTKEEIFEAHKKWDSIYAPENPQRPVPENRDKDKTLRVGLVSGGFRKHPVGWMIVAGMEHLPQDRIELVYYSNHSKVDDITKRLHKTASEWRVITGFSDDKVNQMIREDEIDILIELSGHAAESRLRTVTMEPAPVIVKWVGGLINTTGLKAIDYLISDWNETPAGSEPDYLEKLVRLPDDYICFTPSPNSPDVKESPYIENGFITFGCFNNPIKVNPVLLEKWASVIKRVPKSRLFLKSKQYGNALYTRRIEEQMVEFGIGKDRLIFEGYSPHSELLEAYNRVDIALDPWPYSGGLTTCEALWMGVPVITCPGPTFAGRHAATHLVNTGLPELVADRWEEYIDKAVELANNPEKLAELRSGLRSQVADSPLSDGPRFGAHFAKAMRSAWHQWVDGFDNNKIDWQDHIDVDALDDEEIDQDVKSSKPADDVQEMLDHIEREMNGTASDEAKQLGNPDSVNGRGNGIHTNGSVRTNGAVNSSEANAEQSDEYKIETCDGLTVCTPPDLKMMTPYVLLEQKQWYENELDFVRDYLKPGMKVLDIGAGFGVYSLPAAKLVGSDGKVFAFEPGSVAKHHLEMSKLENGFQNLEVIGKAVSSKNGKYAWKLADTPELNRLDESGSEEVSAVTLDAWWQFEGEPKIDLIKLDVTGRERDVLEGAKEMLKQESPVVLISIADLNDGSIVKSLTAEGFKVFEYIPGPGILADHEPEAGTDPYLQNLVAVKEKKIYELKKQGWFHDETHQPEEPKAGFWKTELSKLQWTNDLIEKWQNQSNSEGIKSYLQALDYLIAAEQIFIHDTEKDQPRSQKAILLLGAAQILIGLYNQGANSTSIIFTLVRTLNALGKRGQAVEVMQKLIETTKLGQENMNVDLPFMLPISEQDSAPIKTDLNKWLMVKTIEAWILMKDVSTYFSGPQEQKLLEVLEGNPEVIARLNGFKKQGTDSPVVAHSNGSTNGEKEGKKNQPNVVHVVFNHVYAQSLSDLIEHANQHSDQKHRLFIETHRAISDYTVDISNNPASTLFNFKNNLQSILQECLKDDVDMVMFHGIFFDWQKSLIKSIGDKKHIGWVIWGGDLYRPINNKNLAFAHRYIDSVHGLVKGDRDLYQKYYGTTFEFEFGYPYPGLYGKMPSKKDQRAGKTIVVGNSGDEENRHIEILRQLADKSDIINYKLLLPVAYNLSKEYKYKLIKEIHELGLSENVYLHEKFIHPQQYADLLASTEMLITAHNRQQSIGNILISFYLNNPTFLKKRICVNGEELNNPSWKFLTDCGLNPLSFEEFIGCNSLSEIKRYSDEILVANQKVIKENFGLEFRAQQLIKNCTEIKKRGVIL